MEIPDLKDPVLYVKDLQDQLEQGVGRIVDPLGDDMRERKELRLKYPGACLLAYQHVVKCVVDLLIGWDPDTQRSREGEDGGVFGPVEAWGVADEEQGRKDLHGHWLLWVRDFNRCRRDLFSENPEVKRRAFESLDKYIKEVMSSSYPRFEIQTSCCGSPEQKVEELDPQVWQYTASNTAKAPVFSLMR